MKNLMGSKKMMDVTLITGFLGSGKTTLLQRLLREKQPATKLGVIVNDLSELEVDGELIRRGHAVSEDAGTLVSLNNGSISDKNRAGFAEALRAFESREIEHVLIETSGGSHPAAILEELKAFTHVQVRAVITLVDARALHHDYEGGPGLLRQLKQNQDRGVLTSENLLASQLEAADVIALTKMDLLVNEDVKLAFETMRTINPSAILTVCQRGQLDLRLIFQSISSKPAKSTNRKVTVPSGDWGIGTDVLRDPRPFHPQRLYEYFRQSLGLGIFRSKGFMWIASRPDHVLLWNQAGGAMGLEILGTWRAAVLKDKKLLAEEREGIREILADQHPIFGDRGNEITVIGTRLDRSIFMKGLWECLCTEREIKQWVKGSSFADPWPKTFRSLS